jgi:NADPH:quinone reductase
MSTPNIPQTMTAIVITKHGDPSVLQHQRVPTPSPAPGEVLVRVRAFGLNHAEMHMRKGEWDEWHPISGLECVGEVAAAGSPELAARFPPGSKVVAVMGGMGRSRAGGYGEYVAVPASNVARVETALLWEQLAALPEVYCTAWTAVFTILGVRAGERLLIRGATSTIGQAALHLAVDAGAAVTATTRQEGRFEWLKGMGAANVLKEEKALGAQVPERFDKVLNLVGNSVLLESIALTRTGGRMLQAGWLGGLEPVKDFNPMVQMESGVHFSLFHSKNIGTANFPLEGISFQEIVKKIEDGKWDAKPTHVFEYADIQEAHRILDSHAAGGKIVVKH